MKNGVNGCGNIGSAIARSLSNSTQDILISDRSGRAAALAEELGISYGTVTEVSLQCDRIFLGIKPHMVSSVLEPLRPILKARRPLIISMAAGLEMAQIREFVGCDCPIIRIMPNTPTAVGKGVIPYCAIDVDGETLRDWLADMVPCGFLDPLDESMMDAASALSGSGPAYLYLMLEAMADGAVACGLPRQKAMDYAAATMSGAAEMALQTKLHPGALKDAVCSPGGSTIAGIRELEQRGFRGAVIECILAAYAKNKELGK